MKTLRINFVDFTDNQPIVNNVLTALRKRYDVQICEKPDYLFFSCFGFEHLRFDGVKIFYTGEDVSPDFNLCDYAIGFDEMQFGNRYLRFPNFATRDHFITAQQKHLFTQTDLDSKTGFCNFVYSNGSWANPLRKQFFEMLSQYKHVDSGGRYLNNIGGPIGSSMEDKLAFQSRYKFSIAFENGQSDGYTTEKILDAFAAKTIPIYWGNPHVAKDFNEKAFINCNNYASLEEVVERVKEIDNDDELYRAMLAEPIFTAKNDPERFSQERLEQFLYDIFDQPLESARRRSRNTFKQNYVADLIKRIAFYDTMRRNPLFKAMKHVCIFASGIVNKIKR